MAEDIEQTARIDIEGGVGGMHTGIASVFNGHRRIPALWW